MNKTTDAIHQGIFLHTSINDNRSKLVMEGTRHDELRINRKLPSTLNDNKDNSESNIYFSGNFTVSLITLVGLSAIPAHDVLQLVSHMLKRICFFHIG